MRVIDADAHVIENESTRDYMLESERQFKPKIVGATNAKDLSIIGWSTAELFRAAMWAESYRSAPER